MIDKLFTAARTSALVIALGLALAGCSETTTVTTTVVDTTCSTIREDPEAYAQEWFTSGGGPASIEEARTFTADILANECSTNAGV